MLDRCKLQGYVDLGDNRRERKADLSILPNIGLGALPNLTFVQRSNRLATL